MIKTQPQPSICAECLHDLYEMLLASKPPAAVHCKHNATLAFIRVESDTVQHWRLIGPVGAIEAQAMFQRVDESRQIAFAAIGEAGHRTKH